MNIFLFISTPEVVFILFVVLMVFGADKIPEIARGLGKGMREIKNATNDIKSEIQRSVDTHKIDTSFVDDIKKEVEEVKDNIEDASGRVKRRR